METNRLLIRPLTPRDTEDLYAVLSDAEVMRHIETPFTRRQTAAFIARVSTAEPPLAYAVVWKETDAVIGQLIYHPYDAESWELGWILSRDYWRRGIANELTAAVMADAQRRKIPELVLECAREQLVTQHIAQTHGFRYLGEESGLAVYRRHVKRDGGQDDGL